jgi:hypothetical protein
VTFLHGLAFVEKRMPNRAPMVLSRAITSPCMAARVKFYRNNPIKNPEG